MAKESEDGGENMQLRFSDSLSDTAPNIYYTPDGANWVQNSSGTNYNSGAPTWYKKFDLNLASGNGKMPSYVPVSLPQYFTGSTTAVSVTGEDGKTYSVNYEKSSSDSSYNKYLSTSANNSYKSKYYIAPTFSSSGVFSYAHIAYAGSGNGEDTWYTKDLSVSLHINDTVAPTVKAVYVPKGELHQFEKATIAVEFSEVVATANSIANPIVLTTNCGTFNYAGGNNTNIFYFDGVVTAATASSLSITGFTGTVKDYAGNTYSYSSTNAPSTSINVVSAQPKNGTGTSASPYEITTPEELNWFFSAADSSSCAKLMNDIVINNITISTNGSYTRNDGMNIARYLSQMDEFRGTFDGCGYTISGIEKSDSVYSNSLFYSTKLNAVIKNLTVDKSFFNFSSICSFNYGLIENCVNYASFSNKNVSKVAGICSTNEFTGIIRNCLNAGNITIRNNSDAYSFYSGICAYNSGYIYSCVNTGAITPASGAVCSHVGGICGHNIGSIYNSYNTGSIGGKYGVGAVCGSSDDGVITNCYYLTGCAKDSSNVVQFGLGASTSGQTTADVVGKTAKKSSSQFSSGEVAYLLNSRATDSSVCFYQNLNNGKTVDSLPTFDSTHGKVYPVCTYDSEGFYTSITSYTNTESSIYQPAVKITDASSSFNGYYEISNAGQLYWFAEKEKSDPAINGVLKNNINLNKAYTFLLFPSSGLVRVSNSSGTVGYLGTGVKGTSVNKETALTAGSWFSDTAGTAMAAPTGLRMWTPIGKDNAFKGTFDGNGNYVYGLYYVGTNSYVGLFGKCGSGAKIRNVSVKSGYIYGNEYLSGICGELTEGTIERCKNNATVCSTNRYVGGICGSSNKSNIINCGNDYLISANYYAGGVCGDGSNNTFTNCYNTGIVNGHNFYGDICAKPEYNVFNNCYYLGTQNGDNGNGLNERTKDAFLSGEVTWLLNGSENPASTDTPVWYQNVSVSEYPSFNSARGRVYRYEKLNCDSTLKEPTVYGYANSDITTKADEHNYVNGFCTVCDCYEPATLVTASNYAELGLNSSYVGYYCIENAGQLYWFAKEVNDGNTAINAVLKNSITVNTGNLSEYNGTDENTYRVWTPIGTFNNRYAGTFDGNGKTISGLYCDNQEADYVGFFGDISGTVKNLGIIESYLKGDEYVGSVCGSNRGSNIIECYNTATVIGNSNVGGVCGRLDGGSISSCYNTGTVIGNYYVCGMCGYLDCGSVSYCYNAGNVTEVGKTNHAGIVGYKEGGSISSCYYLKTSATCGINANVAGDFGNIYPVGEAEPKTVEQFASGEVAYLLNGSKTDGTQSFYQNINNGMPKDAYPQFIGGTVYGLTEGYSNSPDIGGKNNATLDFDFTNHYIITDSVGITSLDVLLMTGTDVTLSGTKSNGVAWGTGSTVKQSKNGTDTNYTLIVKGDLDGDGVCDVFDCSAAELAQSGNLTPSANQVLAGDSNDSGVLDVSDYQQIVNKSLSLPD